MDDSLAFGKRFANVLSRNRFFSGQGKAADGKDLIYEGIATREWLHQSPGPAADGKDLIYEGIATLDIFFHISSLTRKDGKDLIYEGIATLYKQSSYMTR